MIKVRKDGEYDKDRKEEEKRNGLPKEKTKERIRGERMKESKESEHGR